MIYDNMEFYNISELGEPDQTGARKLYRVPRSLERDCFERVQVMNYANCGVEIRFLMKGDQVKLKLRTESGCARPAVFYGNIGAGWQECLKNVYQTETEIVVQKPDDESMRLYEQIAAQCGHPFDPHVVRLVFSNTKVLYIGKEGETSPPKPDQLPQCRYLAYGSSITHGSLAISQLNTWTYRVARAFDADLINLGIAGGACLEKAMANYIASRTDWNFATLEMGINILDIDPEDYRSRIEYFIPTVASAHPDKKIFCIDVFYCNDDLLKAGKAERFREIMREILDKLMLDNVVYINGLDIMDGPWGLSGDLVHPNAYACEVMGRRMTEKMKVHL